jgi:hypothetical protein
MVKYRYKYEGPVLEFDRLICSKWKGETIALDKQQAISNLAYQFKKKYNRSKTAKITLMNMDKYIKEIETVME